MVPEIVYEDRSVCVIDKPSGMVVNDSLTVKSEQTVQAWFKDRRSSGEGEYEQKGGVVHRLDKDTSGLMILAKTAADYEELKKQFMERKVNKTYTALVHGEVIPEEKLVSLPVSRHPGNPKMFAVTDDKARTAITRWQVSGRYRNPKTGEKFSLLQLFPLTGRTHQLRVHLQHFHYPIVGDRIYGYRKSWFRDLDFCPRLFLHAGQLEIIHPASGEKFMWKRGLPLELETALKKLEKT